MSIELQLSTERAQKALKSFERSLATSQKRLNSLDSALGSVGKAAAAMTGGLGAANTAFNKTSTSSKKAAQGIGLFGTRTASASASTRALAGSASTLRQVMAGLGIAMGGLAVGRLIKSMYELNNAMVRIKILFDNTSDGMQNGGRSLEFLRKTARATGLQIDVLAQSWSTFGFNVVESGFHIDQAESMFKTLSATMRVLNLSAEQSKRTFQGFQQIVTKGSFSMEEIKQQIGENVPALKALEKAVGVSGKQLQKMLKEGQVGLQYLMPLMEQFNQQYARLLPESMQTTAAAFDRVRNELKFLGEDLSKPMFQAMAKPLSDLASALQKFSENNEKAIKSLGESAGKSLGTIIQGIAWTVENSDKLYAAWVNISYVITAIVGIKFYQWFVTIAAQKSKLIDLAVLLTVRWGQMIATTYAASGAFAALGTALRPLLGFLAPLLPVLAVIGTFVAVFVAFDVAFNDGALSAKIFGDAVLWIGEQFGYTADQVALLINYMGDFFDANKWWDWINVRIAKFLQYLGVAHGDAQVLAQYITGGFRFAWNSTFGGIINMIEQAISAMRGLFSLIMDVVGALTGMERSAKSAAAAASSAASAASAATSRTGTTSSGQTITTDTSALREKYKDLDWVSGNHSTVYAPGARIGGLTNKMGTRNPRSMVPASAFVGAPHFANGGVTGPVGQSGIPAILHPNEAVIPLQNGAVPVAINGDKRNEGIAQALNQIMSSGSIGSKQLTIKGSRGTETISMSKIDDLQEFIGFAEQWAKTRRQKRAAKWDYGASQTLTSMQKLREEHEYKGFTTKKGMSGGDGKTYSVPSNYGGGPGAIGAGANRYGKYGEPVKILNWGGGWNSGNLVISMDAAAFNPEYYKDIRPDFDYAGNTGLGWDIPAGISMRHYKAAVGATLMGVPMQEMPGATPAGLIHRGGPQDLDDKTRVMIGSNQMSNAAGYAGLAMFKAMKKQGMDTFSSSAAKAYQLGKKDALNPPGIRKLKMGNLTAIERAVRAGQTVEQFMEARGIKEYIKTKGGYARNPGYAATMDRWAEAAEKFADWSKGGSMGAGANIQNLSNAMGPIGGGSIMAGAVDFTKSKAYSEYGLTEKEAKRTMRFWAGENTPSLGGMASGTANTSKDPRFRNAPAVGDGRGGRMVTLHPNEAVIPLRNGKVPIQLGSRAMGQGRSLGVGAGGSGGSGTVVVNMNIHAQDVESFRRSKPQLIQDLTVEMRRAKQQIGTPAGEDLTKVRNAPAKRY